MRTIAIMLSLLACGPDKRSDDQADCTHDGAHRCNGTTFEVCSSGSWTTEQVCSLGCAEGLGCIVEACAQAAASRSYMACEYWAADLDNAVEVLGSAALPCTQGVASMQRVCALGNATAGLCDPPDDHCPMPYTCQPKSVCALDAQHAPFAIVVSNPQTEPVDVSITGANNATITQTVPAGQVDAILPQQLGIPDQSLDGTGRTRSAYRIASTLPIVAYQFNPLDNVDVFSNDASLLIPRSAFDVDYFAITWPTLGRRTEIPSQHDYHGYVTIVAWQDGTRVEVTPTADIVAGPGQPAIAAGTTVTFALDAFGTLNLEAVGPAGDLSGTHIHSVDGVTTFGVFAGHEAAAFGEPDPPDNKNTRGPCCADHLEEMVFPTSTWGKTFAIARSKPRTNENDVIRIVARVPNTSITFDPAPTGTMSGDCTHLDTGQHCTVRMMRDTQITATQPILVGHYLQSAIWNGGGNGTPVTTVGDGDPSMSIAVPIEQQRTSYTILIPHAYDENYLSIATGLTGTVTVDGTPVTLEMAPSGAFRVARLPVGTGQHAIECPEHCGVEIYGYSDAVSYMFAGGLDLRAIVL